jgi:hypothetical protein
MMRKAYLHKLRRISAGSSTMAHWVHRCLYPLILPSNPVKVKQAQDWLVVGTWWLISSLLHSSNNWHLIWCISYLQWLTSPLRLCQSSQQSLAVRHPQQVFEAAAGLVGDWCCVYEHPRKHECNPFTLFAISVQSGLTFWWLRIWPSRKLEGHWTSARTPKFQTSYLLL